MRYTLFLLSLIFLSCTKMDEFIMFKPDEPGKERFYEFVEIERSVNDTGWWPCGGKYYYMGEVVNATCHFCNLPFSGKTGATNDSTLNILFRKLGERYIPQR